MIRRRFDIWIPGALKKASVFATTSKTWGMLLCRSFPAPNAELYRISEVVSWERHGRNDDRRSQIA